jgi:flavin reductase (DIM6/NTAB) family NADH-FMN oxidoreductase RutF
MTKKATQFQSFDFKKIPPKDVYSWMVSLIAPRPIAFVSTTNIDGDINLAPFSFFTGVSSNPPCLVFSVTQKKDGTKKDTLINIERTGEFVVNTTHQKIATLVNETSHDYPYGVSELQKVGFHTVPSQWVQTPRIAESLAHIECKLEKLVPIGDGSMGSSTLVIGRILGCHVSESIFVDGAIDYQKLDLVARLGGPYWQKNGELFFLPRPSKKN